MLPLVINNFSLSGKIYFLCKVLAWRENIEEMEYAVSSPCTIETIRSHLIIIYLMRGHSLIIYIVRHQFIRVTPGCIRKASYIPTMWMEEIQFRNIKH